MAAALNRDKGIVLTGIVVLVLLSWAYLLQMAHAMNAMAMDMTMVMPWTGRDLLLLFVMWVVMMVAMMLPSALPMILAFAGLSQRRRAAGRAAIPAALFVSGYVLLWTAFSALATGLQWLLHERALVAEDMLLRAPWLAGALLIGAGLFQWTPLKQRCLQQCRSPLAFLMADWREGYGGAWQMGLHHGVYCVGCCWALMLLLFVAGVMNLLAVAAVALFVLLEKYLAQGERLARAAGLMLIAAGLWYWY